MKAAGDKQLIWPRLLCAAGPLVLLAAIWLPEIGHHYVPSKVVSFETIAAGRKKVPDAALDEIRKYYLLPRGWKDDTEIIGVAQKLMQGRAELPGFRPISVYLPFDPADLTRGAELWQLQFAGLVVPEVLLEAYRRTEREEYFFAARDSILAFGRYEKGAWVDRGFLWNDHAVAARVRTLADFWAIYRHRSDYDPDTAQAIWNFAARTGAILAKPDNFTFATNHGVMQNLALWQLCIAFSTLESCSEYDQLALRRLTDQMAFYVAPDGAILEHSAEYLDFGVYLEGLSLRYATLLKLSPPKDWKRRYELSESFYADIRRPDGSLPMFGDAMLDPKLKGIAVTREDHGAGFTALEPAKDWRPSNDSQIYPISNYGVLWEGLKTWPAEESLAQAFLVASYFPGHGHKHADELSVLFWAGGQNWWTGSGYWPYDDPGRLYAEGWQGSNAPHLAGESARSERKSSISRFGRGNGVAAVEMDRQGPGTLVVKRLVVHVSPDIWIVTDSFSGTAESKIQTLWTTAPGVHVSPGARSNEYLLSFGNGVSLGTAFLGGERFHLTRYFGSHDPFAGWVATREGPEPAEAFQTEQNGEHAYAFLVWRVAHNSAKLPAQDTPINPAVQWTDETSWSIHVHGASGDITVVRHGEEISEIHGDSSRNKGERLTIAKPVSDVASENRSLTSAYQRAAARYPRFRELLIYRTRASLFVLILFGIQEAAFFVFRSHFRKIAIVVPTLATLCWIGLGVWLHWAYLVTS